MRNHFFFIILTILFPVTLNAQTWSWAVKVGGNVSSGAPIGMDADAAGNSYVYGIFEDTIVFAQDTFIPIPSIFTPDVYLAKYDKDGNVIWGRQIAGTGTEEPTDIIADALGNTYIVGNFRKDIQIGNDTLSFDPSFNSMFIAKYDAQGNTIWAKQVNGNGTYGDVWGYAITIDQNGNSYVAGNFTDTVLFDAVMLQGVECTFIAKYDPSGNVVWAKNIGETPNGYVETTGIDNNKKIYIQGTFAATTIYIGYDSLFTVNKKDFFTAKFDSSGNYLSSKAIGNIGDEYVVDMKVDMSGNRYFGGYFSDSLKLGAAAFKSKGSLDIFVAKMDTLNNFSWAKQIGGKYIDQAYDFDVDNSGNSYITGFFYDTAYADGIKLINPLKADFFVAKYASSGSILNATQAGGAEDAFTGYCALDPSDNLYMHGDFQSTISFGGNTVSQPPYVHGLYLAKLTNLPTYVGYPENTSQSIVFPNPFSCSATIKLSLAINDAELNIYNLAGEKVKTIMNISDSEIKMERAEMTHGVYIYNVKQRERIITSGKIVILE